MKPRKTWVLVADGARARVLENDGPGKGLQPALGFDFAAPHAATRDFVTDKPGRGHGPGGTAHHAKPPRVDWHTFEKHLFAKTLADALDGADQNGAFDDLVLVAPPKALGELRQALGDRVKAKVKAEVGKDLTHLELPELGKLLGAEIVL